MNVLFVCNAGSCRSPTAEYLYKKNGNLSASFAGINSESEFKADAEIIEWADFIICMEDKQAGFILNEFSDIVSNKKVHVLNIPDKFGFMDPSLINLLSERLIPVIGNHNRSVRTH